MLPTKSRQIYSNIYSSYISKLNFLSSLITPPYSPLTFSYPSNPSTTIFIILYLYLTLPPYTSSYFYLLYTSTPSLLLPPPYFYPSLFLPPPYSFLSLHTPLFTIPLHSFLPTDPPSFFVFYIPICILQNSPFKFNLFLAVPTPPPIFYAVVLQPVPQYSILPPCCSYTSSNLQTPHPMFLPLL